MNSGDLRIFEAVARLGGMNRAAAELNTVQSNVTARVRQLEDRLGTPLFERHSRGVALTAAGNRLLPYARQVASLLVDARRAATDDGRPRGGLTVGSLETTAALRLSPVLEAFAAQWPEVDLVLRTGTTRELIEDVLERRLEGAFVCGPVEDSDLVAETVFEEELAVATAASVDRLDDLVGRGRLKIVVLRAGCSYRQRLEEVLTRRGIVAPRLLEFGTIETIVSSVAGGLGVTLMPRAILEPARRQGRIAVHALPPAEARVKTLFVRRHDAYLSSALAAFLDHARPTLVQAEAAG